MRELIEKQTAIDAIMGEPPETNYPVYYAWLIKRLPAEKLEPLTDEEQRIFLSAMEREMEVCEEIDCEAKLTKICKEIKRKVMGALWS